MIHHISRGIKKVFAEIALLSVETIVVLLLFVSSLSLFLFIADVILIDHNVAFDQAVFDYLSQYVTPLNNSIMLFFTFLGTPEFLIPANINLFIYFAFIRKHKWYSIKIPVIAVSSMSVMIGLKDLFQRPRPLVPLLFAAEGMSFPSGHALMSVTFYGLIIYILWERMKNNMLKWICIFSLLLLILIIGFSRIYLRVHYASDVLAGFCIGTIWLIISIWSLRRIESFTRRKIDPIVEEKKIDRS